MDLWIRSQDRTRIEKFSCLSLSASRLSVLVNGYHFGTYGTTERALEVVDEIQMRLQGNPFLKINSMCLSKETELKIKELERKGFILIDGRVDVIPSETIIYEIPKE